MTDNKILLDAAKRNYYNFNVPTKMVDAKKIARTYTPESLCDMDIATSVNKIGEIVNLSQELNTLMWSRLYKGKTIGDIEELYCDIAQLDVMSNIEIDSAKKEYPVDNGKEISLLKEKYLQVDKKGRKITPNFFMPISQKKGYYNPKKKAYISQDTTMDYLQRAMKEFRRERVAKELEFTSFSEILNDDYKGQAKCNYDQIERAISIVQTAKADIDAVWADNENYDINNKHAITDEIRQNCTNYIKSITFNGTTMYELLKLLEDKRYTKISRTLFSVLFGSPNTSFFEILDASRQPVDILEEDPRGSIKIYDFRFSKTKKSLAF